MSGTPWTIGLELGGTKAIAVLARGEIIVERTRVPTSTPGETLTALTAQVAGWRAQCSIAAIGIASFGPVDIDPASATFGRITTTTKPGWQDTDLLAALTVPGLPFALDTDVNGAVLAEQRWGAARGCDVAIYITVGTGIGGGVAIGGRVVHGLRHPEIGHIRVRRPAGDDFPGICAWHGDCLEGLASGPAIAARAGVPAPDLPEHDPTWDQVADTLAEAMATLLLTLSPQRILIGGGVGMGVPFLLPRIRARTAGKLAGYVAGVDAAALDRVIVHPALGDDAGPLGAVALALDAYSAASNVST